MFFSSMSDRDQSSYCQYFQAKLRKGSQICPLQDGNNSLSTASNNNNSLSLHTTDLNYSMTAAVPIHCSTIDGIGLQDQKLTAKINPIQSSTDGNDSQANITKNKSNVVTTDSNHSGWSVVVHGTIFFRTVYRALSFVAIFPFTDGF